MLIINMECVVSVDFAENYRTRNPFSWGKKTTWNVMLSISFLQGNGFHVNGFFRKSTEVGECIFVIYIFEDFPGPDLQSEIYIYTYIWTSAEISYVNMYTYI